MPNMDGTGPRFAGQRMGRGNGRRGGAGRGYAGCWCGFGPCAQYAPEEKTALEARKAALKRSLDSVEKRLETL
ncbi:MAG: DUF5320 domain-containing protein [Clostridiales bacterium]|nr:DUF5320 domain-containing protein [Clostridiales bacterium]